MDIVNDNVQKIGNMFPECITEIIGDDGTVKKVVDFSILNQLFDYNTINNPSTGGQRKDTNLHGQTNQRQGLL